MSGGAARLARRTRQRRERRYRRRIRRCIGCNTVDSGNVSSRLPQPDCGAATDAVSGPHRRHTTTAPAVGPQLRSTLRRGSDGRRDSRNIAALRHRPGIGAASEIRRILDQRLAAVRGLPHHRSSRGHVPRGSRPQSHRGFPRLEPHPHLAWATRRFRRRTHHLEGRDPIDGAERAQPARRHHRMGLGAGPTAPSGFRRRRPQTRSTASAGPAARHRCCSDECGLWAG